jgi:hypothetical protein
MGQQEVANRERDSITVELDDINAVSSRRGWSDDSSHLMTQR